LFVVHQNKKSEGKKEKKRPREYDDNLEQDFQQEKPKRAKKGNADNPEGPKRGVVSSLFSNNPEIPRLPPPNVKKQKLQPLFSDLTFDKANLHPFMASAINFFTLNGI